MEWKRTLDRVHTLAGLDAFAAEPGAVATQLEAEVGPASSTADLDARDALLRSVLAEVDALAVRAMRLRLEHALAADTSIAPPTRTVFARTIVGYAGNLALLGERARDVAARTRGVNAAAVADLVVEAARSVLELRDAVLAPFLQLVARLAAATAPEADARARDQTRTDAERTKWSAIRRDQEALAASPILIASAPLAARLAALPAQLDEPPPKPEVSFADMIEMD